MLFFSQEYRGIDIVRVRNYHETKIDRSCSAESTHRICIAAHTGAGIARVVEKRTRWNHLSRAQDRKRRTNRHVCWHTNKNAREREKIFAWNRPNYHWFVSSFFCSDHSSTCPPISRGLSLASEPPRVPKTCASQWAPEWVRKSAETLEFLSKKMYSLM